MPNELPTNLLETFIANVKEAAKRQAMCSLLSEQLEQARRQLETIQARVEDSRERYIWSLMHGAATGAIARHTLLSRSEPHTHET